jgi:hypothetical protein
LAQICEEMQADSKALASIAKHQVNIDSNVSVCGVKQLDFWFSVQPCVRFYDTFFDRLVLEESQVVDNHPCLQAL